MLWPLRCFRRRAVVGWCVTCKRTVYAHESSVRIDGDDVRQHERCDYRARP